MIIALPAFGLLVDVYKLILICAHHLLLRLFPKKHVQFVVTDHRSYDLTKYRSAYSFIESCCI